MISEIKTITENDDCPVPEGCIFDLEWLNKVAKRARSTGFIGNTFLTYILALDEQYQDDIPRLWHEYEMSIRKPKNPDVSTQEARVGVWLSLFERWTVGTVACSQYLVDPNIQRMGLYSTNEQTGEFKKDFENGDYLELSEIKEYFSHVLGIPLPVLLFPLDVEANKQIGATAPDQVSGLPAPDDPDAFIRSLQVSYVSDTEISITAGNDKAKNYTCNDIGFKSSETGWKLLMEVLKDKDHLFDVGTYSKDKIPEKNKVYNQRQKWITQFRRKLITFINREYGKQISIKLNIFENQKKKNRDGLYKPLFQVASNDVINSTDIKKMSQKEILKKIEKLGNDIKQETNEGVRYRLLSEMGVCAQYAEKKKWITPERLRSMISIPDEEVSPDDAMSIVDKYADINDS